jgi:hypothetical protein
MAAAYLSMWDKKLEGIISQVANNQGETILWKTIL